MTVDITPSVQQRVDYHASASVRDRLKRMGRVEAVSFSPNNDRIAIAGFHRDSVAVIDAKVSGSADRSDVSLTAITECSSSALRSPHGIDWLDDETVIVANRGGSVSLHRVPRTLTTESHAVLPPLRVQGDGQFGLVAAPGAVTVTNCGSSSVQVYVGDNTDYKVTKHELVGHTFDVVDSSILLSRWVDFPDGVAVSPDGQRIAVANHDAHMVFVYRSKSLASEDAEPDCVLRGAWYPHGLCFADEGRALIVADVAVPFVHVFRRHGDFWGGAQYPSWSMRVMSDELYAQHPRAHLRDAGPKGVFLDRSGLVVAVTSELLQLEFYNAASMLRQPSTRPTESDTQRLQYELMAMNETRARLEKMRNSRSMRITKPLRALNHSLNRVAGRP